MANMASYFNFEYGIHLFDLFLILLFPTAILEGRSKFRQLLGFMIAFGMLIVMIKANYMLDFVQNIMAIIIVYIYTLVVFNGGIWKKLAISTVSISLFSITTVHVILIASILFGIETNLVFSYSMGVLVISRLYILMVMFLLFYFTKKEGNLNQVQWLFMALLFFALSFCNSLLLVYINEVSVPIEHRYSFVGISNCIFFIAIVEFIVFARISKENEIKTQNTILVKEKLYQKRNMETIRLSNEEISHLKHDFKSYILIIEKYIQNQDYENAIMECRKTTGKIDNVVTLVECNPKIIGLIINEKIHECKALNIDIKSTMIQDILVLDETDFILVFTNLMDNAIEHSSLLNKNQKKINLEIREKMGYIILKIENVIDQSVMEETKFNILKFNTTKKDKKNHGIGHKSIETILKNGEGEIKYSIRDDLFIAEALFKKKQVIP